MPLKPGSYELITDLVVHCQEDGTVLYANPAMLKWSDGPLVGRSFFDVLVYDETRKGQLFVQAVGSATPEHPTLPWELLIGTNTCYAIATFAGYRENDVLVLVGHVKPESVIELQQEMDALTSELAESQREVSRQNRLLQQVLSDQRQLVSYIMYLTAPAVPVWDGAVLMELLRETSGEHLQQMLHEIWQRVGTSEARYLILDMGGLEKPGPDIIQRMIDAVQVLEALGPHVVLADAGSGLLRTVEKQHIETHSLHMVRDVRRAVAYVSGQLARQRADGG